MTSFNMKRTWRLIKYDAWYRISCVFIWWNIGGRWLYWKWNSFLAELTSKKLFPSQKPWVAKFYKIPYEIWFFFLVAKRHNPAHNTDMYPEPCQISKLELFAEIGNGWKPLTSFTRWNHHLRCISGFWMCLCHKIR